MRIDDPRETVDQRGLFSVAFPPDHRRSGRFYVHYVDRAGRLRVDELRRGRRGIRHILDLGAVGTQHHGGQLQFGPDGLLYVSTGMNDEPCDQPGSGAPGRQDPARRPAPAQPVAEVYALGLRNPWRFSFDRRTGAMFIGDVGEAHADEIDVIPPRRAAGHQLRLARLRGAPPARRRPALRPRRRRRSCCGMRTTGAR